MKKIVFHFLIINFILFGYVKANTYIGEDVLFYNKYRQLGQNVFDLNLKTKNKTINKIQILWTSLFGDFIQESLYRTYINIGYPKKLISCFLQKDEEALMRETKRFLVNSTFNLIGFCDYYK